MSTDPIDDPALAPLLRALRAPADERELLGLDGAARSFRAAQGPSRRTRSGRASMVVALAGAKLAGTVAALAVGVGGVATVAYVSTAGPVPTNDARQTAAAGPTPAGGGHAPKAATQPKSSTTGTRSALTAGPTSIPHAVRTTGSALPGDRAAPVDTWHDRCGKGSPAAEERHARRPPAFPRLAAAAGGSERLAAWCAAQPRAASENRGNANGRSGRAPTGNPQTWPKRTEQATTAPTGRPAPLPTTYPPGPP